MTRAPVFTKAVSELFRVICAFCVQGYRGNRLFIGLVVWIAGCSDSTDPADIVQFRFEEQISSQILHVRISSESIVRDADQLMQSGEAHWLIGRPVRGDGGFNTGWAWHLDPASISFAEVTIEACQSAAAAVSDDLDYWIGFGQVCIWGAVRARE